MSPGGAIPLLAAVALASSSGSAGHEARTKYYALVIGVNQPGRPVQAPLRFADDDAARFYQLFAQLPGEAALFTLLDPDTQRELPELVEAADLPERGRILERLDRMFAAMRRDRERGLAVELYLVYSGHGEVDEHGEGRLTLQDGFLTRADLYDRVLARSPAQVNHVVVDACDAYFFVQARGSDPAVAALLDGRAQAFMERQTLSRYPNTGAILSTASAAESHEWSEIRGGVFSHEVRSALLGAADADGDGQVSYDELEAFVRAANRGVRHVGARSQVFVRAPARDRGHPVIDLGAIAGGRRLEISPAVSGRLAISDELGRRYLDLNKAPDFRLALRLLPGARYVVHLKDAEYPVPEGKDVRLAALSPVPPSTGARGVADAYARGLFATPFGPQLVAGFELGLDVQRVEATPAAEVRHPLRTAAYVTGGAALVAGGLALTFHLAGNGAARDYEAYAGGDLATLSRLSGRVQAWDTRTNIAAGAGTALGAAAVTLLMLDVLRVEY